MFTVTLPWGLRMAYLDPNPEGAPAVLLLHGLGATGASWEMQFPALIQAGMRPVAPDLRGFGQSSYPGSWTMEEVVRDLTALLDHLGLDRVHVVGISMGGAVALAFGYMHPERTRSLVLVNTFARLRPRRLRYYPYFLLRFLLVHLMGLDAQARLVAKRLFPRPEQEELRQALLAQIAQAHPRAYRAAMRALVRFDFRSRLSEIPLPALVVTGGQDTTVPPQLQEELAKGLPHARQVVFPEAGHGLIVEDPEGFNRVLVAFLKQVEGQETGPTMG